MKTRNGYLVLAFGVWLPLVLVLLLGLGLQSSGAEAFNLSLSQVTSVEPVAGASQVPGHLSLNQSPSITSSIVFTAYLPTAFQTYVRPYLEKIHTIPDYWQLDPAYGGLPDGGKMYCAPVAVSNSLMWLDDNGYDNLVPNTADRARDQFDLIWLLGSSNYMDTSLTNGTGVNSVLNGLDRFVRDKGYQYARLEYQGWRHHDSRFSTGVDVPNLAWVRQGIEETSSAWLNYGRYSYDAGADEYKRSDGHWVTLVGYGHDSTLATPTYLVVHDPGWPDGSGIKNLYLTLEEIGSGMLSGDYNGLPKSAVGFHKVTISTSIGIQDTNPYPSSESETVIVLDGVVVLEMSTSAGLVDVSPARPNLVDGVVNDGN